MIDANSGELLFEKNADSRRAVASTQKLLTALLILENGNLARQLQVASGDTKVSPTKLYLRVGEKYSRLELFRAMIVKSANDAAMALARDNAGSISAFAAKMNARARSLGMRNSNFKNPSGLSADGQYSTARDMSVLARYCYHLPAIMNNTKRREYVFQMANNRGKKTLENTNKVLKRSAYCTGMKTGYTNASGRCLIASGKNGEREIISIILGATTATVWDESQQLLEWALLAPKG